jgi:hypothetical protein
VAGELTAYLSVEICLKIFTAFDLDGGLRVQIPAYSGGFFEWYAPSPPPICESLVDMRVGAIWSAQLANLIFISNGLRVKS